MLKIRLSRLGTKHKPFYRIVVTEARSKRSGKSRDQIGYFDPKSTPPKINIDQEKYQYWQSVGAQPTPAVIDLINQHQSIKN